MCCSWGQIWVKFVTQMWNIARTAVLCACMKTFNFELCSLMLRCTSVHILWLQSGYEENGSMRMCYNYIFVVTGSYSTLLAYKTQWYVHKVGQFGIYKATCMAMIFRAPIFLLLQMMSQNWNHYNCSTCITDHWVYSRSVSCSVGYRSFLR